MKTYNDIYHQVLTSRNSTDWP